MEIHNVVATLLWHQYATTVSVCSCRVLFWSADVVASLAFEVHSHWVNAKAREKILFDVWFFLICFTCTLIFFVFAFTLARCERAVRLTALFVWSPQASLPITHLHAYYWNCLIIKSINRHRRTYRAHSRHI